ncbi:uncharacterized protein LOC62_01G001523 [Vanrija pseudolonga]|uniref:Uncharacterized protein n=1 Tax=Vanrija pseudolonga TaxID=143232 RepID=A0AAF0Y5C3_9TREE|nr:hypothetical protein LOC62_01G001523 [Vanrija pseudolonga]
METKTTNTPAPIEKASTQPTPRRHVRRDDRLPFQAPLPPDCLTSSEHASLGRLEDLEGLEGRGTERLTLDLVFASRDAEFKRSSNNFKRELLAYTEVFTIDMHHSCSCAVFADVWAELFPNLIVLRIAPIISDRADNWCVAPMCSPGMNACPSGDESCAFLTKLKPSKIVWAWTAGSDNFQWNLVPDVEVFLFLCASFLALGSPQRLWLGSLLTHWPRMPAIKIVFLGSFEGSSHGVGDRRRTQQAHLKDFKALAKQGLAKLVTTYKHYKGRKVTVTVSRPSNLSSRTIL